MINQAQSYWERAIHNKTNRPPILHPCNSGVEITGVFLDGLLYDYRQEKIKTNKVYGFRGPGEINNGTAIFRNCDKDAKKISINTVISIFVKNADEPLKITGTVVAIEFDMIAVEDIKIIDWLVKRESER